MSVELVEEIRVADPLTIDEKGNEEWLRQWLVRTTHGSDDASVVKLAPGLPGPGSTHPSQPLAVFKGLKFGRRTNSIRDWFLTGRYSTAIDVEKSEQNPLLMPVKRSGGGSRVQRSPFKDLNDKLVLNSCQQPFAQGPQIDGTNFWVKFERNEAAVPTMVQVVYQDCVNSKFWFGVKEGHAKIQDISWVEDIWNGIPFYRVTYMIEISKIPWHPYQVVDQGSVCYSSETGELERPRDRWMNVISVVNLDGQGYRIPEGELRLEYIDFQFYDLIDFNTLGLVD